MIEYYKKLDVKIPNINMVRGKVYDSYGIEENGKFIGVQSEQRYSDGKKTERIYSSTDGENWTLVHDPNY